MQLAKSLLSLGLFHHIRKQEKRKWHRKIKHWQNYTFATQNVECTKAKIPATEVQTVIHFCVHARHYCLVVVTLFYYSDCKNGLPEKKQKSRFAEWIAKHVTYKCLLACMATLGVICWNPAIAKQNLGQQKTVSYGWVLNWSVRSCRIQSLRHSIGNERDERQSDGIRCQTT